MLIDRDQGLKEAYLLDSGVILRGFLGKRNANDTDDEVEACRIVCESGMRGAFKVFVSAVTIGEIVRGDTQEARASNASAWVVLPFDEYCALRVPAMSAHRAIASDVKSMRTTKLDAFIAATAIENDLCVVSLDEEDFKKLGAEVVTPRALIQSQQSLKL